MIGFMISLAVWLLLASLTASIYDGRMRRDTFWGIFGTTFMLIPAFAAIIEFTL